MTAEYMRARWPGVFIDEPVFPALDPLAEAIVAAQNQLDAEGWGRNYCEAVVLLAGHIALLGTGTRASGARRAKAGLVELEYGGDGMSATGFKSLYDDLLKRRPEFRIPDLGL